ncbi:hypothetical protein Tco_0039566 [Tanacetum coccineum]
MAIQLLLKELEMVQMMIKNPPLEQTGGPKEEGQEKELNSTRASSDKTYHVCRKTTPTGSRSQEICSQLPLVEDVIKMKQAEKRSKHLLLLDWFQKHRDYHSPDHAGISLFLAFMKYGPTCVKQ